MSTELEAISPLGRSRWLRPITLLVTTTSLAINETLAKNKGFEIDALVPVPIPVEAPELLAANPKHGIRSLSDALREGRTGKLYFGSSGVGSGSHIDLE